MTETRALKAQWHAEETGEVGGWRNESSSSSSGGEMAEWRSGLSGGSTGKHRAVHLWEYCHIFMSY